MVTRAREHGLDLSHRDVFSTRHPRRWPQGAAVDGRRRDAPETDDGTGPVPLTPVMHWLLEPGPPLRRTPPVHAGAGAGRHRSRTASARRYCRRSSTTTRHAAGPHRAAGRGRTRKAMCRAAQAGRSDATRTARCRAVSSRHLTGWSDRRSRRRAPARELLVHHAATGTGPAGRRATRSC
ncbi:hypothetical protein [Streptomyces thioluteus]|uniref:hypothetical protein n=1 Tax=Streptomyces thioluteus TaxID=66431 RepID=UPI003CD08AE6